MLADMNNGSVSDYGGLLNPPSAPFAKGSSARNSRDNFSLSSASNLSLSVNYLPSKFTPGLSSPSGADGMRNRKGGKNASMPKRGGGLEAFRAGEARLPQGGRKLRWNKFKWILFAANTAVRSFIFRFYGGGVCGHFEAAVPEVLRVLCANLRARICQ